MAQATVSATNHHTLTLRMSGTNLTMMSTENRGTPREFRIDDTESPRALIQVLIEGDVTILL